MKRGDVGTFIGALSSPPSDFLTPKCLISLKWPSFVGDGDINTFSKKRVALGFLRAFKWSADWALPPGFE
jgi:hypothetical protein